MSGNIFDIEKTAKKDLENRKGENGEFTSYNRALLYYYKRLYKYFRTFAQNKQLDFDGDISEVIDENKRLKEQIAQFTSHNRNLKANCENLQRELDKYRPKVSMNEELQFADKN